MTNMKSEFKCAVFGSTKYVPRDEICEICGYARDIHQIIMFISPTSRVFDKCFNCCTATQQSNTQKERRIFIKKY